MKQESKRQEWAIKLEQWRSSGKTARAWCLENNVPYHRFLYWAHSSETSENSHTTHSFIELEQISKPASGITIEYNGILINIASDFDPVALNRCLQALRGNRC